MTRLTLALPGDPETLTGGYLYDRRLCEALRRRNVEVDLLRLDEGFPFPDAQGLRHARSAFATLADHTAVLVDGLALGAMPEVVASERKRLRIVALVHHPLGLESGLDAEKAAALEASEREALAVVRHVVVTSSWTAALLEEHYGVRATRLSVAEPGTDPAPPARGSGGPATRFICVATLIPRKGHDLLVDALAPLAQRRDWQLLCIGSDDRDPGYAQHLREQVHRHDLQDRVQFAGEMEATRLHQHYHEADAFVLPTYLEGYGMALAEAVARGLPVITTAGGAAEDTAGPAALLVPPGDRCALTDALARLLDEPNLRRTLSAAAVERAATLPTWDDAAAVVEQVVGEVCG